MLCKATVLDIKLFNGGRMNNERMFIWSGQKCRRGVLSPVLYCNDTAVIGEKVIDNRGLTINRGHEQQTRVKWTKHWRERSISRDISPLDTIDTMQYGIRFRSDIRKGNRWIKRAVYLFRNFVVVSHVHPKYLVTCYKMNSVSQLAFDLAVFVHYGEADPSKINTSLRNCTIAV
jgi:hypothetical protein